VIPAIHGNILLASLEKQRKQISRFGTDEQYILWSNAIDMVEEMLKNVG
jgi:hypothetical protein